MIQETATKTGRVVIDETDERLEVRLTPSDPDRTLHDVTEDGNDIVLTARVGDRRPKVRDEVTMRDENGVMRTFEVCGTRIDPDGTYKVLDERGAWLRWEG